MPKRKGVASLSSLCLGSVAQHMQGVWVKDYSENYLDEYHFRYIMGPFNELGERQAALGSVLLSLMWVYNIQKESGFIIILSLARQELGIRACKEQAGSL